MLEIFGRTLKNCMTDSVYPYYKEELECGSAEDLYG